MVSPTTETSAAAAARYRRRFRDDGIGSVSSERLVVLLYERLLRDLEEAVGFVGGDRRHLAHARLVHAQEILSELDLAVDSEAWEAGHGLQTLYRYAMTLLVRANVSQTVEPIREVIDMLSPLAAAWQHAYRDVQRDRQGG